MHLEHWCLLAHKIISYLYLSVFNSIYNQIYLNLYEWTTCVEEGVLFVQENVSLFIGYPVIQTRRVS